MEKLRKFIETYLIPITEKVSNQRHLRAVRDGVIHTLPLILIGSFFLLLGQPPGNFFLSKILKSYSPTILLPFRLTFGLIAFYVVITISYSLAKTYKMDAISTSIISAVCFFISASPRVTIEYMNRSFLNIPYNPQYKWFLPIKYFGTEGLFLAIIVALVVVEILRFLQKRKLMFTMPKGVPDGVAKAFEAIIPSLLTIIFFWLIRDLFKVNLPEIVIAIFSPIKRLGDSLVAVIIIVLIDSLGWFAGIHPVAITGSFVRPIWLSLLMENADKFSQVGKGAVLPHIAVDQFYYWFVWVGGAGGSLGLVVNLFFAKSKYLKQLAKVCVIPVTFNINEPLIFGLPIVANPLMIIPFTLAPLICGIISYGAFYFNLVQRPYVNAPWTLPAPFGAWVSTGFDWRAFVLSVIVVIISAIIYYPFFKVYDKNMLEKEEASSTNLSCEKS